MKLLIILNCEFLTQPFPSISLSFILYVCGVCI